LFSEQYKYMEQEKKHLVGTYWVPKYRKWDARIGINRKKKYIGRYDTMEEAHEAYMKAKADLDKDFTRLRKDNSFPAREAKTFGERIRWIRLATSSQDGSKFPLTPEALSEKAGIHVNTLMIVELGRRGSHVETVLRLADALNIPPALLFCGQEAFVKAVEKKGWTSQRQLERTFIDCKGKQTKENQTP
jgi:transcriptional regulator with XRE-family HTH domain